MVAIALFSERFSAASLRRSRGVSAGTQKSLKTQAIDVGHKHRQSEGHFSLNRRKIPL